jgi:hypothetical protein
MTRDEIMKALCDVVVTGHHESVPVLAQQIDPPDAIVNGLTYARCAATSSTSASTWFRS